MNDTQRKLCWCAREGDSGGVRAALAKGAHVNDGSNAGAAGPLHLASEGGHLDVVKLLLQHKVDVNMMSRRPGDHGGTSLHLAAESGHKEVMDALLGVSANSEALDNNGRTPLHWAAYSGQLGSLEVLQNHKCDLHALDKEDSTALHLAAAYGDLEVVRWLVRAGLDAGMRDQRGKTAKDVAKARDLRDIQHYLKQQGGKKARAVSPWRGSQGHLSTRSRSSVTSEEDQRSEKTQTGESESGREEAGGHRQSRDREERLGMTQVQNLSSSPTLGRARSRAGAAGEETAHLEEAVTGLKQRFSDTQHELDHIRQKYARTQSWQEDRERALLEELETNQDNIKNLNNRVLENSHKVKEYQLTLASYKEQLKDRDQQLEGNKHTVEELRAEMERLTLPGGEGRSPRGAGGSQASLKLQQEQKERIRQLESKLDCNKKIMDDMNEEIDDMDQQIKQHEISIVSYQSKLKGRDRVVEEMKEKEVSLQKEIARMMNRLEKEQQRVSEVQGQLGNMARLDERETGNQRLIATLRHQLREEDNVKKQQAATLRQQLLEEEAANKRALEALRKQMKEEEDFARKTIVSLRQQLQEASDKHEVDSFNRQHISGLREQLEEVETSGKRTITVLRQQLEEQENSKREMANSFRQQLQEQEDIHSRATSTLKQQLQEEAEINAHTVSSLRQQLNESSSTHNQDVFNRGIISSLRQQLQEAETTSKRTITALRLQLQDQDESSTVSVTTLKHQLQEEEKTNRQTITALRQQLSEMSVRVGEEEQKSFIILRGQEEKVKELEGELEGARATSRDLTDQLATLNATLEEHEDTIEACTEQLQEKERAMAEMETEREATEVELKEELERLSRRLEEERQKVTEGQSREQERLKKLQRNDGEIEKIIDDLNDEVAEKTSRLGEAEQMLTSYQVQLRHKERQMEQKEATGQQAVGALNEKVEALSVMLEEEHIKLARFQDKLQETEASNKATVSSQRVHLQEAARAQEAEQQRHMAYQSQQQRRVKDLVEREEIAKRTLEERNNKLKEQEKMFATYQTQVQNQKKVMEQSEAGKQQTIATLSAEVVRLTRQVENQHRWGSSSQTRESELQEQDRVNKMNIAALSEKLKEKDTIIFSYQAQKEELVQENDVCKARLRELTVRLTEVPSTPPSHKSNLDEQLQEVRTQLEVERRERSREQEASQQVVASLTSRVEEVAARSPSKLEPASSSSSSPARVRWAGTLSGLPNLGNTCYINSVLQCLFCIHTFRDYFTTDTYKRDVSRDSEQQGQVAAAVADVVKALQGGGGALARVKHLKEVAGVCNEDFRGSQQRNAHDFLSALLTWLHNDTTKPSGSSIITKLFDGERRTTVLCERSGEDVQRSTQIFTTLTLTVPPGRSFSLKEVLSNYYRHQNVEWECKVCRRTHVCRQHTRIKYLPPILVIYLSRTSSSRVRKTRVTFPSDRLSLQDYLDHRDRSSPTYELFGVVNHHGTPSSGHYTAYCRSLHDPTWRHYDDLQVTETSLQRVLAEIEVHILFYAEKR